MFRTVTKNRTTQQQINFPVLVTDLRVGDSKNSTYSSNCLDIHECACYVNDSVRFMLTHTVIM